VLVALADTHGDEDPRLTDHLRETIERAETVVHAGDFTTPTVLDAFDGAVDRLVAVHGNSDTAAVRKRLPATATVETATVRVLVAHGHEHDRTSLSLLARQEAADVVVVGHTHRPGIERLGDVTVVNPGSHADPHGGQPTYATVGQEDGAIVGQLRTSAGDLVESVRM